MVKSDPLSEKSYAFALQIVKFCLKIQREKKEYVITKQLLKAGTSVGANVEEASQAQSRSDFVSKLCIALTEAHESRFWLRLIRDAGLADEKECESLITNMHEIIRMLVASVKTAKSSLNE